MKTILTIAAFLFASASAFAQERVAVWTVPAPQTVQVAVTVQVDGRQIEHKTIQVNAPAGATVFVTKIPVVPGIPEPAKGGKFSVSAPASCPCVAANGFCNCADPFQTVQARVPQGYRMVCDGNSCRLVPISESSAMGPVTYGSCADGSCGTSASGSSGGGTRTGPIRRIFGRIFAGRRGAGGGSCCGG